MPGKNAPENAPYIGPSPGRVLLGFLPAMVLSVLMLVLLAGGTVLAMGNVLLDWAARAVAFGAYWCVGSYPPAGKWPRG